MDYKGNCQVELFQFILTYEFMSDLEKYIFNNLFTHRFAINHYCQDLSSFTFKKNSCVSRTVNAVDALDIKTYSLIHRDPTSFKQGNAIVLTQKTSSFAFLKV